MAYRWRGPLGNRDQKPVRTPFTAGVAPWGSETEDVLRSYMMAPRRQLFVIVPDFVTPPGDRNNEGNLVLVAPARDPGGRRKFYPTDALNGPRPIDFKIVKWGGVKTCEVEWACLVSNAYDCEYFDDSAVPPDQSLYRRRRRSISSSSARG